MIAEWLLMLLINNGSRNNAGEAITMQVLSSKEECVRIGYKAIELNRRVEFKCEPIKRRVK